MNKPVKRKDGRYQIIISLGKDIYGKVVKKYVYGHTPKACKEAYKEYMAKVARGEVSESSLKNLSVFANEWIDIYCKSLSPTTVSAYRKDVNRHIIPVFRDMKIQDIRKIHVTKFANDLSEKYKHKTVKNIINTLHKIFSDAIDNSLIKTNPADNIKIKPDTKQYEYYIYTVDEFLQLLKVAVGTRFEIPVILAGFCGLRRGEIHALQWEDIDFLQNRITISYSLVKDDGTLRVKRPKTDAGIRSFEVPQTAIDLLRPHRGLGIIMSNNGNYSNCDNFSHEFAKLLERNNLPHTRFHDLRHFNATLMMTNGVPDKVAASRLGHADTNITKKYQHILRDMEKTAAGAIDKAFLKNNVKTDVNAL